MCSNIKRPPRATRADRKTTSRLGGEPESGASAVGYNAIDLCKCAKCIDPCVRDAVAPRNASLIVLGSLSVSNRYYIFSKL